MQLNEILEENSVKSISKKTNISEENLEALFVGQFDALKKVKAVGFISIVEREYHADLSALKKQALEYYGAHAEYEGIALDVSAIDSKKGSSPLLMFGIFILLGVASWYFMTQFDKDKLQGLLPFNEEKMVNAVKENADRNSELSIGHTISEANKEKNKSDLESMVTEEISVVEENQSN